MLRRPRKRTVAKVSLRCCPAGAVEARRTPVDSARGRQQRAGMTARLSTRRIVRCRTRGHGHSAHPEAGVVARRQDGSTTPWCIRALQPRPPSSAPGADTVSTTLTTVVPAGYGAPGAAWRRLRRGRATSSWRRLTLPGIGPRAVDSKALATWCFGARAVRSPIG
jgi:hypothetical protein